MSDIISFNKTVKKMVTPAGIARWSHINKEKVVGDKRTGKKSISVLMDPSNAKHAEFLAELYEVCERGVEMLPKAKRSRAYLPYKNDTDKEGNETGLIEVGANTQSHDKEGNEKHVTIVDAAKNPLKAEVFGGSTVRVSTKPYAYSSGTASGVKLFLNAVQVLELRTGGGGGADDFEDESDGTVELEDDGEF